MIEIITEPKEQLYTKLDEYFSKIDSSWGYLSPILKKVIEKYDGKWEKESKLDISRDDFWNVHDDPRAVFVVSKAFRTIGFPDNVSTSISSGSLNESPSITIKF